MPPVMLYGAPRGTGIITRLSGTHGNHSTGIIITDTIITGITIITDITAGGRITVIPDGMTFITHRDVHILHMWT